MNPVDTITPDQAAKILGVGRARVRQFVAAKELATAGKFGSTTMFSRAAVMALKKKRAAANSSKKNGHKK